MNIEYRKTKFGDKISTVGIGSSRLQEMNQNEMNELISFAQDKGVNLIDLVLENESVFDIVGNALKGRRKDFFINMHLCVSFPDGQYKRTRELNIVKESFIKQMKQVQTDYVDFCFIHYVDEMPDCEDIIANGILEYGNQLKKEGLIRYLGVATHKAEMAHRFIETGAMDVLMFSINPAYDFDPVGNIPFEGVDMKGQDREIVSQDRLRMYHECEKRGIGIQVMKAFGGGVLLNKDSSPFGVAFTIPQCLQYCLDRPGVLTNPVGMKSKEELAGVLTYYDSTKEERDYSFIADLQPKDMRGTCVYCNHCLPCPSKIDIGTVHKYLDLFVTGDKLAKEHYLNFKNRAKDCIECGSCEKNCPFGVKIIEKMRKAKETMERG